jgi:hypothetical protein
MYENAFEKLKAATHYGTRGIAQQINALHSENVPREETEPYRLYLLSPANYLFEELLTVCGADYDLSINESEKTGYIDVAKKLTGAKIVPIGVHAAYAWYAELTKSLIDVPKPTKTAIKKAIVGAAKSDAWISQGAAALCTRAAIAAETEDPAHAPSIWDSAFDWWKIFFAAMDVSGSQCFLTEKDSKKKEICTAAWGNFRNRLIEDIQKRCFVYITENKGASVNACLETLMLSNVRLIYPQIFDDTLKSVSLKISVAVSKCVCLADALNLWEGLGDSLQKSASVISAMLGAMAAEVDKIDKGHGDIAALENAWTKLDCEALQSSGNIETAPALKAYYTTVCTVSSRVYGDESSLNREKNLSAIAILLRQLPSNYVVGHTATDDITATGLLSNITFEPKLEQIRKIKLADSYNEGRQMWAQIHSMTPDGGGARKNLTTRVLFKLQERNDDLFTIRYLGAFPKEQTFNSDDYKNIGDFIEKLNNNLAVSQLVETIEKIPTMTDGAASGKSAYELFKKAAQAAPDADVNKGILTHILIKLREKDNRQFTLAFVKQFPRDLIFNSEDFSNLGEFVDSIESNGELDSFAATLKDFAEGKATYASTEKVFRELEKAFSNMASKSKADSKKSKDDLLVQLLTAYSNVMNNKLVECVNAYQNNFDSNAQRLGLAICARLPDSTEVGGMTVSTLAQLLSLSQYDFRNRAADVIHAVERKKEASKTSKKRFWFWTLFEGGSILPYLLLDMFGVIDKPNWIAFIVTTIVIFIISMVVTLDSMPGLILPNGRRTPDTPLPVLLTGDHPLVASIICFAIPTVYTYWLVFCR